MKVSLLWFNQYLGRRLRLDQTIDLLVRLGFGCDIDSVVNYGEGLENVCVAAIEDLTTHPKDGRLQIATINIGKGKKQVVTAAKNIKTGDLVLFVPAGSKINKELIQEKDFSGVVSQGMFLSEEELGLTEKSEGVIVLEKNQFDPGGKVYRIQPGKRFSELFDCEILNLETTAIRSDWLSTLGIARELVRMFNKRIPPSEFIKEKTEVVGIEVQDRTACPLYTGRLIEEVTVKESPFWLKWRLYTHGINPINNIVDITNLIMLQFGQPLHAFDYDRLAGHRIIVRRAKPKEPFTTLDGTRLELNGQLVICDSEKPVALAGIVGGRESGIEADTKTVLLESAYFDPIVINRASRLLNIRTESSIRFEKGVDFIGVINASRVTAELLTHYAGARRGRFQIVGRIPRPAKISVDFERIKSLLSIDINFSEFKNILRILDLSPRGKKKVIVSVPSYRNDLRWEADIAEEVARVYGYDRIPEVVSPRPVFEYKVDPLSQLESKVKVYFVGKGFYECCSFSLVSARELSMLGFDNFIRIKNPLSENYNALRPTLIINFLNNLKTNIDHFNFNLRLFEVGKVFEPSDEKLPREKSFVGGICGGEYHPLHWTRSRAIDFFDVKGFVAGFFEYLKIDNINYQPAPFKFFTEDYSSLILIENRPIGCIGLLRLPFIDKNYYYFEVNLDEIVNRIPVSIYLPLPRYPVVTRDLSFLVSEEMNSVTVLKLIRKNAGPLLKDLQVFDYYEGGNLPQGKKNLGFRLVFRSEERTLKDEEVDRIISHIVQIVSENTGAVLRKPED